MVDFPLIRTIPNFTGYAGPIYGDSKYLYVTTYPRRFLDTGIYIYSKSDFSLVKTLTDLAAPGRCICGDENYIYWSGNDIRVYGKTDFSLVNVWETETPPQLFCVDANYLYLFEHFYAAGSNSNKVYIYQKNDFSLVKTLTEIESGSPSSIYVDADYLYCHSAFSKYYGNGKTYIYEKTNFSPVKTLTDSTDYAPVYADEKYLYVGSRDGNIYFYEKTNFSLAKTLRVPTTTAVPSINTDENYLYVVFHNNRTRIYNKRDLSLVTTLYSSGRFVRDMYVDSKYLYIGSGINDPDWFSGDIYIYQIPTLSATTNPATNITATSMQLNGSLNGLGNYDNTDCYFQYTDDENFGQNIQETTPQNLTAIGEFSDKITGLEGGKTYYFRAVARVVE